MAERASFQVTRFLREIKETDHQRSRFTAGDKNIKTWYLTIARFLIYFLDALSLRRVVTQAQKSDADVVIFDRYIYDELANLSLKNPLTRAYARLLLTLAPQPDVAYLLDADPVAARERKPEYPIEFLHANRAAYLAFRISHAALQSSSPCRSAKLNAASRIQCATQTLALPVGEAELIQQHLIWRLQIISVSLKIDRDSIPTAGNRAGFVIPAHVAGLSVQRDRLK